MENTVDRTENPPDNVRYGLLRIGRVQLAVSSHALVEIVPQGAKLHPCPLPSNGFQVCGSVLHRGSAVPVLNIATLLGTQVDESDSAECKSRSIALIRSGEAMVGLLIDEAVRVSDPATSSVIQLQGQGLEEGFFRSYLRSQEEVSYILDPKKIVDCLSSQMSDGKVSQRSNSTSRAGKNGERALIAVVRWGAYVFGIRSQWVLSAQPACALQETGMDDTLVRGFLPFQEDKRRAIAVVNLSPFLGLPQTEKEQDPAQYLLLAEDQKRIAVGITSVCGLDHLEVDHLDQIQLQGIAHPELFEGALYSKQYGQMLILNGAGILNAPSIRGMVNPPPPPPPEFVDEFGLAEADAWLSEEEKVVEPVKETETETEPVTFVVYRAAQSYYATTTKDLDGIVIKPQFSARLGHSQNAMEGFIHWRGASVPVLNLTRCLGFESQPGKPRGEWVLVHRSGGTLIGFLVESVDSLTLAKPTSIPTQVAERRDGWGRQSTPVPQSKLAISFKDAKGSRTAFVLDLGSLDAMGAEVGVRNT